MKYKVIIPARYHSTRLPGKPLVLIDGVSMIERTWRQCRKAVPNEMVVIATDDQRIIEHCNTFGAQAVMTPDTCETGTDRIAALLNRFDVDYFINVQGDEPLMNPDDLNLIINETLKGNYDVINGYAPISKEEEFRSFSVPKVIFNSKKMLMYMSRGAIPVTKANKFIESWRQICIYSFSRKALEIFKSFKKKTPIERIEDIEILRFLELNIPVKMLLMSDNSIAVDHPEDVEKVAAILKEGK
ncbi:MAG: 3-deoxy-manno-octulosonate cytidylyltransferase [Candidatus Babeliales bacterium]